jgi:hypothetical protein
MRRSAVHSERIGRTRRNHSAGSRRRQRDPGPDLIRTRWRPRTAVFGDSPALRPRQFARAHIATPQTAWRSSPKRVPTLRACSSLALAHAAHGDRMAMALDRDQMCRQDLSPKRRYRDDRRTRDEQYLWPDPRRVKALEVRSESGTGPLTVAPVRGPSALAAIRARLALTSETREAQTG